MTEPKPESGPDIGTWDWCRRPRTDEELSPDWSRVDLHDTNLREGFRVRLGPAVEETLFKKIASAANDAAKEFDLRVAFLFGSCATGLQRDDSDLDIAVRRNIEARPTPLSFRDLVQIGDIFGSAASRDCAPIDLDEPHPLVNMRATQGVPIFGSDADILAARQRAQRAYEDYLPTFTEECADVLKAIGVSDAPQAMPELVSVDREVVMAKIIRAMKSIAETKGWIDGVVGANDNEKNRVLADATTFQMHPAIRLLVGICRHTMTVYGAFLPRNSSESIRDLGMLGTISTDDVIFLEGLREIECGNREVFLATARAIVDRFPPIFARIIEAVGVPEFLHEAESNQ